MATYTIETSAAEEKALAYVVAERNAQRALTKPPKDPLTHKQYLDQILVRRSLLSFKEQMEADEAKRVKEAYLALNNQDQNEIKTLLGL